MLRRVVVHQVIQLLWLRSIEHRFEEVDHSEDMLFEAQRFLNQSSLWIWSQSTRYSDRNYVHDYLYDIN